MAKQNAAARRKAARRVKKNVERGQAAGQVQAVLDSKVQGNLLPMQHRWQQRQLPRLRRFMD